jgi:hypothetical protein
MPEVRLWQCECPLHGWFRVYTPFILPHKHYAPLRVDAALGCAAADHSMSGLCSDCGIHDLSTPRRWVAQWAARLCGTARVVGRHLRRLVYHLPGVVVRRVRSPSEWSRASAWTYLGELRDVWPTETLVPPLSYLALKA